MLVPATFVHPNPQQDAAVNSSIGKQISGLGQVRQY